MSITNEIIGRAPRAVSVGWLLPTREAHLTGLAATELLAVAELAESEGLDSVWAGDSLFARPRVEPLGLLCGVAARTSRVTIGTAALTAALRHPLLGAHSVLTLDALCEGRLVLGLGAGFPYPATQAEFEAVGVPFEGRGGRLEQMVETWRGLWAPEDRRVAPHPSHDDFLRPVREGGPPLWLAGGGPMALERAGRSFDGWLPYPPSAEDYASGLADVHRAAEAAGRDPSDVTPGLYATVVIDDEPQRARGLLDEYCSAYYGVPAEIIAQFQATFAGTPDDCHAWLTGYLHAGARHLVIRAGVLDHRTRSAQLRTVARDIAPRLRGVPA